MKQLTMLILALCCMQALAQQDPEPGTFTLTPVDRSGLVNVAIQATPEQTAYLKLSSTAHRINIPSGYTAKIFAAGSFFMKPRTLAWGPDSVLYVCDMTRGIVYAMPDRDRNGVADSVIAAVTGLSGSHCVEFYRDTMFVTQTNLVYKLWDANKDLRFENRVIFIDRRDRPAQNEGHHTRTLVIDSIRQKFYYSVGSRANADRESDRALIEEYDWNGKYLGVTARGIRNAVGMTLHPRTGRLWANNNGSDQQGNEIPPEWVDLIRDGGFYGYPYAYHHQSYFNFSNPDYKDLLPITAADSALVRSMRPAAALVTAHSAPMQMVFTPTGFPAPYSSGAFMCLRGSWNRSPVTGMKLIFVEFENDQDTIANVVREVCTGFLTDSISGDRWARPVGVAVSHDGSIYLTTDDGKEFVLKLERIAPSAVPQDREGHSMRITPSPASESVTISADVSTVTATVSLFDAAGQRVYAETVPPDMLRVGHAIDTRALSSGSYQCVIEHGGTITTAPVVIQR
jgi:glucose/arabinose dehydrogenase